MRHLILRDHHATLTALTISLLFAGGCGDCGSEPVIEETCDPGDMPAQDCRIREPAGPNEVASIEIRSAADLEQFCNSPCSEVYGDINVYTDTIADLKPLKRIKKVRDINVVNLSPITLDGLNNLEEAYAINISNATNLKTLTTFNKLSKLTILEITDNPELKDLGSFPALRDSPEDLESLYSIRGNDKLISLEAFSALEMARLLQINTNFALTSLKGLENFKRGGLTVAHNRELHDISALRNYEEGNAGFSNNRKLSSCDVIALRELVSASETGSLDPDSFSVTDKANGSLTSCPSPDAPAP